MLQNIDLVAENEALKTLIKEREEQTFKIS